MIRGHTGFLHLSELSKNGSILFLDKQARVAQLTLLQSGTGRHNKKIIRWTDRYYTFVINNSLKRTDPSDNRLYEAVYFLMIQVLLVTLTVM